MEWLNSLLFEYSALQAVVVMAIIIAAGLGLGKLRFGGISLGVTCVFFAGILAGHLGLSVNPDMLTYAESFGLVLFVYELGLQVGPGFFSSFRQGGIQLNMLGFGVILMGTLMAILISKFGHIPMGDMLGILCGATTNTPALGAAQQTLKQLGEHQKPIIFLNISGFYDGFLKFLAEITKQGFVSSVYQELYVVLNQVEEILPYLEHYTEKAIEAKY